MDDINNKILVIIPAYNEAERISDVVHSIDKILHNCKILVIDDNSKDDTKTKALEAGAEVLSHPVNMGYGVSLETGYIYALKYEYDILIQMDADGQHLGGELPKILEPVLQGDADIVIGSRYLSNLSTYKTSFFKHWGHKFFGAILAIMIGRRITDPTSGYQCMNKKVVELFAGCSFPEDFPDTDVLLMAHFAGVRVKEVPVVMLDRKGGTSMHTGFKPFYYVVKVVLSMFMVVLNYRRWQKNVS